VFGGNPVRILESRGNEEIAMVYVADMGQERLVEFVESTPPPTTREQKWVLIISPLYGCPVGCPMCDAGGGYRGKLTKEEMFSQIDHMVYNRYPDGKVPVKKFKVQFARMGEPALNPAVLDVLEELPNRYEAPGLLPSLSSVAPHGTDDFFKRLKELKDKHYPGRFQLQFSIHSTCQKEREKYIPIKKWDFKKIASYGHSFREEEDKRVTLNFISMKNQNIEPEVLSEHFSPEDFLIKITPLNPTTRGKEKGLTSGFDPEEPEAARGLVESIEKAGFQVILSIGDLEENKIGSNCGQYVQRLLSRR